VRLRHLLLAVAAAIAAVAFWLRKNPSACPYSQRFWVEAPHPFITRSRLREVLAPRPGERVLEVGPGTGYYTLDLAEWAGPDGSVEILDIQQEMLDHTMARAAERDIPNINPTLADATKMPYEDSSFDAAVLVTVLGEVPDQDAALRELARVLKPGGRLVVGELLGDPHYVAHRALRLRVAGAGLAYEERSGSALGYFARFAKPGAESKAA
jgi:ubiquinone/menaquinone biosynthesis C-methylase UbiE